MDSMSPSRAWSPAREAQPNSLPGQSTRLPMGIVRRTCQQGVSSQFPHFLTQPLPSSTSMYTDFSDHNQYSRAFNREKETKSFSANQAPLLTCLPSMNLALELCSHFNIQDSAFCISCSSYQTLFSPLSSNSIQ